MVVFQQLQHDFGYCLGFLFLKNLKKLSKDELWHTAHPVASPNAKCATCFKVLFAHTRKQARLQIASVRVRAHARSQLNLSKLWIAALLANSIWIDSWLDVYSFDIIGTNCGFFLARITKLLLRHNPIDFCLTNVSRVWEKMRKEYGVSSQRLLKVP